jgi:hypothetical protein
LVQVAFGSEPFFSLTTNIYFLKKNTDLLIIINNSIKMSKSKKIQLGA